MAFTIVVKKEDVYGSTRVRHLLVTADAVTAVIETGMQSVHSVSFAPKSMASSPWGISAGEGAAGTAIASAVGVTGMASGDDFYITIYGT